MEPMSFEEAVALVVSRDPRYEPDAYAFLRQALDHTIRRLKKPADGPRRHVSGRELADGFRDLALREFGPMALRVLNHWGLKRSGDIGDLVYNLIETGVLGRSDEDRREHFDDVYDFERAFRFPFLAPVRRAGRTVPRPQPRKESPAP